MKILEPYKPEHPILPMTADMLLRLVNEHGSIKANEVLRRRNNAIRAEEEDPLNYGHKFDHWLDMREALRLYDELCVLGGNRSSKTEGIVDLAVDTLCNGPTWKDDYGKEAAINDGVIVAFFHSSSKSSANQQQARVYDFLPPEWRDIGKQGKFTNVSYTRKNGFSDDIFILPNGAMGMFFNYKQDVDVMEGYEFDLAVFDELVPLEWVEAVRFRLATKRGKMIVGFAPVHGYNQVVKEFQAGARITETKPADPELFPELLDEKGNLPVMAKGCPPGQMPYRAECANGSRAMFWFHSVFNLYSPYEEIVKRVEGRSTAFKKIRAYGYCENTAGSALPHFSEAHIITRKRFNKIAEGPGCRYCITDPGGTKNWFIKWYYSTPEGWTIVYREWPDYHTYGEWALPTDKIDFKAGPAQYLDAGRGIPAYKKLILELEGWVWDAVLKKWDGSNAERIEQRIIDSRFGALPAPSGGEGTSIIDLMWDENYDKDGALIGPSMDWDQAAGGASRDGMKPTEVGIQMLNDLMDYDRDAPLTALNCPKWYIVEDLLQTRYCYTEFTGQGTHKDALKDIIDPDRYYVSSDIGYMDDDMMSVRPGGSY